MHAVALGVFRILKTPMAHPEIAPNLENARNNAINTDPTKHRIGDT